jgi:hypothetical protein
MRSDHCPKAARRNTHQTTLPNHRTSTIQSPDTICASLTHNHCMSIVLLSGDLSKTSGRLAPHVPDPIDNH